MLYLIRDKNTGDLLFETVIAAGAAVEAGQIYPDFDAATMEPGHWPHDRDDLPEPFEIDGSGAVRALTLDERIARNLISFGDDLIDFLPQPDPEAEDAPPSESTHLDLVELALEKGLIRTAEDCGRALTMMNEEIETRVSHLYPIAVELKRVKECLDWVLAGHPADDPRQARYREMNDAIAAVKDAYKAARGRVKQLQASL